MKVLAYYSAHLSPCQQRYHPFEQEFWGLLCTCRDMIKQLGRIPAIIHTDHANIARVEGLPLERIESKHFRWNSELRQGGGFCIDLVSVRCTRVPMASHAIRRGETG